MNALPEQRERLIQTLLSELQGPVLDALNHPRCEDIVLNSNGQLWAKMLGSGWQPLSALSAPHARSIMYAVANLAGKELTYEHPFLETILPVNGARFEAVIPPVTTAPVFAIRCRAKEIYTFDNYVEAGIMTVPQRSLLETAIRTRKTVLISGSTGSGKTTLLNACLSYLATVEPLCRLALIEDTPELQCELPNQVTLLAHENVPLRRCLAIALRMIPDRIIVGEVRGPEALDMLKACNTGHPGGLTTIHANSPSGALLRLESLVQEAVPGWSSQRLIAEAIQVVVQINGPVGDRNRRIAAITQLADDGPRQQVEHC